MEDIILNLRCARQFWSFRLSSGSVTLDQSISLISFDRLPEPGDLRVVPELDDLLDEPMMVFDL